MHTHTHTHARTHTHTLITHLQPSQLNEHLFEVHSHCDTAVIMMPLNSRISVFLFIFGSGGFFAVTNDKRCWCCT